MTGERGIVNVVLSGVGGQGVLLAARSIAEAALAEGYTAYMGEVHGMAQRGGTVIATVRIGAVTNGMVGSGEATLVVGLEAAETYRMREYLNATSWVVMNECRILPVSVNLGKEQYPSHADLVAAIRSITPKLMTIPALELAVEAGTRRAENTVMLGAVSVTGCLPFGAERLRETVLSLVPLKYREINEVAFELGRRVASERFRNVLV